jgi:DNA-binding CsgD family transcriptional regulator
MEKHLEKQQIFLSIITESLAYIRGDYVNVSKVATKEMSKFFGIKRVSVWLFKEDGSELQCISLYQNKKYMPLENILSSLCPQYISILKREGTFLSEDVSTHKNLTSLYQNYFYPNKVGAVLDTTIKDGGLSIGILRMEHIGGKKKWKAEDLSISALTATIIGHSFTINTKIEAEEQLYITKKHLLESNVTHKNVLDRLEIEKKSYHENVALNIERNIDPLLKKLKDTSMVDQGIVKRLEIGISDLSSDFYKNLVKVNYNLTPTEVKVCQMIKGGYQGKEIAGILKIAFTTVETHKKNIRRKLNITGKSINLRVYLNELDSN